MRTFLLILVLGTLIGGLQTEDLEHPQVSSSSSRFLKTEQSSIETLKKAGFEDALEAPGLGASSSQLLEARVSEIKAENPIVGVSEGERGVTYDVILQPGHYGRVRGAIGTSGHLVSERALAAYITSVAAKSLRDEGLSVLVISADRYLQPTSRGSTFDGLRAKVFLAIHADGSAVPCKTGPSLAYESKSSLLAMHTIGMSLATALGYSYPEFRRDNFTVNEAHYYMFSRVRAERLTGLLEVGELTCPEAEKRLVTSSRIAGHNLAKALNLIVKLQQPE